jgi:hypothetical protein
MDSLINIGIILTYVMIGAATLSTILFGLKKMLSNTKNAKKTLYTIGGLIIVSIVSYIIASGDVLSSYEKYDISSAQAKNVGMGLVMFYILAAAAIASVLFAELSKAFKK